MSLLNKETDNMHKGGVGLKKVYEIASPLLHLSADQESKINESLSKLKEERQNIKTNSDGNLDELRNARQAAKQDIMNVLDEGQKKVWRETAEKLREEKS